MNIENLLHDEIVRELATLEDMEVGTDSYKVTIDGVTKLVDRAIDIDKLNVESEEKKKARESGDELKRDQMKSEDDFKREQMERDEKFKREQLRLEEDFKQKQMKLEEDFKREQMEAENRDRKVKNAIAIATLVVSNLIVVWGTCKSIKFEETGTFTTIMGRGFVNKLLPKK